MNAVHCTDVLKNYLEDTLGIPCLTKENRPCELMFHPAAVGYPYAKQCRLSVMRAKIWPHVLLMIRHTDRIWGSYAMLTHVCKRMQDVLEDEAPNAMIQITEDNCLQLTLTTILERTSDVSGMILHAFRLLRKYDNSIREEMRMMPEDEDEWDEDEDECDRRPYYSSPKYMDMDVDDIETEEGDEEDGTVF